MREFSGRCSTASTICSTVCCSIDAAALGAVRHADARKEQAQVIVDFGDGADGRARVVADAFLVDGDGGRQAFDLIDVRLFHLAEELARVRAEALDVAPLSFRVDRVERERRLARAGQPGDDDELVARDFEADVLEVVFACAANDEFVEWHINQ